MREMVESDEYRHVPTGRRSNASVADQVLCESPQQRDPHYAFDGQTPDKIYFGTGRDVPAHIQAGKVHAREARLAANQTAASRHANPTLCPMSTNGNQSA